MKTTSEYTYDSYDGDLTQSGSLIPDVKTWYTTTHSNDFDIVRQYQIAHTDFGYTLKTSTIVVNYQDSNGNGIWDKNDSWEFDKSYGSQTKSFYSFGTQEQYDNSPYIQTGGLGRIGSQFWDQVYIAVNGHLECNCYTDMIPRNRLDYGDYHRVDH
jgi:hypothetical protein